MADRTPSILVFPGSFDPVTSGHVDVLGRASSLFDQIVVGVLDNPEKTALFSIDERVALLEAVTENIAGASVRSFHLAQDVSTKQIA